MNKKLIVTLSLIVTITALTLVCNNKQPPKVLEPIEEPTPTAVTVTVHTDWLEPEIAKTEVETDTSVQENAPLPKKPTETPKPPKSDGDYTNKNEPPKYAEKETVKESAPKPSPKNNKGQVYVDGFGYVDVGEDTFVEKGHSKGDINKQVGNMN